MSPVILTEFLTLDGVMEAPGGEKFFSPDVGQFKLQETLDAESLLIGRVTYESFAGAWPARDGAFADKPLMALALVDEYRLMVFPIILGSGKRLFRETPDKQALRLTGSQRFSSGVVVNTFARAVQ